MAVNVPSPGAKRKGLHFEAHSPEETQWLRIVMDRETMKLVGTLDVKNLRVLEISGDSWRGRFPFKSYRSKQSLAP